MVAVEAGGNMTTKLFSIVVIATASVVYAQQKPAPQKLFDTPEAATQALLDAASQNDVALQDMDVQRGCVREREGHRAQTPGQRRLSF